MTVLDSYNFIMRIAHGDMFPPQGATLASAFNFVASMVTFVPVDEITYDSGKPGDGEVVQVTFIELWWPYGGPSTTLTLKTPEFGDQHSFDLAGIVRGDKASQRYQDAFWQNDEMIKFTLNGIKEADKTSLMTMVADSLGTPVGFRDWEDRVWKVIIQPGVTAVETDKNDFFSLQFEFLIDEYVG